MGPKTYIFVIFQGGFPYHYSLERTLILSFVIFLGERGPQPLLRLCLGFLGTGKNPCGKRGIYFRGTNSRPNFEGKKDNIGELHGTLGNRGTSQFISGEQLDPPPLLRGPRSVFFKKKNTIYFCHFPLWGLGPLPFFNLS